MRASLLLSALVLAGCSSSYTPRPSPRVAMALSGGMPTLVRDGAEYPMGPFGGGLVDAVSPNPRALDHAETYRSLMIGGFVSGLVGAGAAGVGVGLMVYSEMERQDPLLFGTGLGLALGGLGAALAGSIMQLAAQGHFFDAINIYNDEVDAATGAPWPPAQGPWTPPPPPPPGATPPGPGPLAPTPPPAPEPQPEPQPEPPPVPAPAPAPAPAPELPPD